MVPHFITTFFLVHIFMYIDSCIISILTTQAFDHSTMSLVGVPFKFNGTKYYGSLGAVPDGRNRTKIEI